MQKRLAISQRGKIKAKKSQFNNGLKDRSISRQKRKNILVDLCFFHRRQPSAIFSFLRFPVDSNKKLCTPSISVSGD